MSPRLTDWSLALASSIAFATGLLSLVSGRPTDWWVFALHGMAGLWLLPLVVWKTRRIWPRLRRPSRWRWATLAGVAALLLVGSTVLLGIGWVLGVDWVFAGYNLLNWHIVCGITLVVAISVHMILRARPLPRRELRDRRQVLRWGVALLGAVALWPLQQTAQRIAGVRGAARRFTGSYELASYTGNAFPTVSWVADNPRQLDITTYLLAITGAIAAPQTFSYTALEQWNDERDAILDCTGGFYSAQKWRGVRIGRLLDAAQPLPTARYVSFVSVTGYRWSLPLAEAREALLATHLGGEPLSHGHGAPLRLVAPGRRGFEWVKWVVALDVLEQPDPGQLAAIYTSSFTPAGRGDTDLISLLQKP